MLSPFSFSKMEQLTPFLKKSYPFYSYNQLDELNHPKVGDFFKSPLNYKY